MSTAADFYQTIRESNVIKYGTEFKKILNIIINQYSDRTHFIYEILQNAEDAGATYIKFHLEKNQLVIIHNGRPFNEEDITGVCGIADGTKSDGTRIGHFGIGFKSVYCYTERPRIYSGKYCFVIKDQLFPEEIPSRKGVAFEETCMVLPFDKSDVLPEVAFLEIKTALTKKITAESILVLNNISDIEIKSVDYANIIEISKEKYPLDKATFPDNVFSLSLRTTITNTATEKKTTKDSDYLFFTDANKKEATAIIFNVEGKELKPVRNSKIYAYFPTAKEAHQNFYIHAPFDTTPARDNFKEGAEYGKHNIELIKNIGELIWFSLKWMKEHKYLSASGLNTVFPLYEYEEDDILYGIYQNSLAIIREEEILPTSEPGVFKNIKDVCAPRWSVIVDVFDVEDLRRLTHRRNLSWLAKEMATEAYSTFRSFLSNNFKLDILDWKDLVQRMDALFLKQKSVGWMAKLFERIESYCIQSSKYSGHGINAEVIPFVRTKDGEQICARDADGKLQVYLNNPEIATYIIEYSFLQNSIIRSFYERALRIPEYDINQEVTENILPKYETDKPAFKTTNHFKENIEDLKTIKNALVANSGIVKTVKESYILTDGNGWVKPTELYIRSDDPRTGYSLVKGILSLKFLSDNYMTGAFSSLNLDEEFFKKIGCNKGLRVIEASDEDYLKAVSIYLGEKTAADLNVHVLRKKHVSSKMKWRFNYEGFPEVFSNMSKKKSLAIARFLNPHTDDFDIMGEIVGADNKQFVGEKVNARSAYSMLGLQLSYEKWIYIKDNPEPYSPVEIEKKNILPEYGPLKRIVDVLPFKKIDDVLDKWLSSNIKNKNDIELVRHYFGDPDKMLQMAKRFAESEAKSAAKAGKSKSAKDLIKNGDKKQSAQGRESDNLDINAISEAAKKKREKKLEEQFAASMDHFTRVTKGVYFANRESNNEERLFLEQEYDGHCQMCLKQIIKHNGQHYFEAINIIKFNDLNERLSGTGKLGWNSLCMCPNCAAEYNYCSKKISTIYDQVMATEVEADCDDYIGIQVEIPEGKRRTIRYSPRHFLALKTVLKLLSDETEH